MAITHLFVSEKADGLDETLVRPSDWNAAHAIDPADIIGLQGPVGDKGAIGDKGLTGDQGPAGDKGPTGDKGATGDAGGTGATGDKGPAGDKGVSGDKGATGDKGPTGDAGANGTAGTAWPIGSVFMAVVATDPATLLGIGTWSQIAPGQFIVGQKAADADFDVAEETGGAKTSTPNAHSGGAVDAHAAHTHAYTDVVNHVHAMTNLLCRSSATGAASTLVNALADTSATLVGPYNTDNPTGGVASGTTGNPSASLTHAVTNPSAHAAMSIVPPYFVVYIWKRTA